MTETEAERLAIIQFDCKVTPQEAMAIYKKQLAEEALRDRIEVLKGKQKDQQMRRQFKKARKIYE